jgi:hypothetical protein
VGLVPGVASPQGNPLGPEFRVNTYTTNGQRFASVASDASGDFVVVWSSQGQAYGSYGIFGQRYASSGTPLGPEFRVNSYTSSYLQVLPVVAAHSSGFVVVWENLSQDGSGLGVYAQRFVGTGSPLGLEFRVNSYTTGGQFDPAVAADPAGNVVVVWVDGALDGSARGIFAQRYAASGVPLGPQFRVNTYTTGSQHVPSISVDTAGNFVVIWQSAGQDGSGYGIFGQRFGSAGVPLGPEFQVNTYTTFMQNVPEVSVAGGGGFVVTWVDAGSGSDADIYARRYASSGSPLGTEFRVNTFTSGLQSHPVVAADSAGNFVIVWGNYGPGGPGPGIFAQRFTGYGTPLGSEFRVNTYTAGSWNMADVAADSLGNFVVVWESNLQDGSSDGIFGQRYNQIVPVELMHFGIE